MLKRSGQRPRLSSVPWLFLVVLLGLSGVAAWQVRDMPLSRMGIMLGLAPIGTLLLKDDLTEVPITQVLLRILIVINVAIMSVLLILEPLLSTTAPFSRGAAFGVTCAALAVAARALRGAPPTAAVIRPPDTEEDEDTSRRAKRQAAG